MKKLTTNQLYSLKHEIKNLLPKLGIEESVKIDTYSGQENTPTINQPLAYARDRHGMYHYLCVWVVDSRYSDQSLKNLIHPDYLDNFQ